MARSPPTPRRSRLDARHAHGRVPLDRQERQRRGDQDPHGQGRQGRRRPPRRRSQPATPGPGGTYTGPVGLTLTATDATSGVAKTEYQVNAPSAVRRLRRREAGRRGGRRVRHVRPGQQAVVHGSGRLLDRLPLDRRGRQRGDRQDGDLHDRRRRTTITPLRSPRGTLDPAAPGAGRTYSAPVTVKFSAQRSRRRAARRPRRRRRRLGRPVDPGLRER